MGHAQLLSSNHRIGTCVSRLYECKHFVPFAFSRPQGVSSILGVREPRCSLSNYILLALRFKAQIFSMIDNKVEICKCMTALRVIQEPKSRYISAYFGSILFIWGAC